MLFKKYNPTTEHGYESFSLLGCEPSFACMAGISIDWGESKLPN